MPLPSEERQAAQRLAGKAVPRQALGSWRRISGIWGISGTHGGFRPAAAWPQDLMGIAEEAAGEARKRFAGARWPAL